MVTCHEQYQGKVNSAKSFTVRRVPISTDDLDEIPSFRRSTLFPLDNNIAPVVLNVRTDFCCPSLCHFEKPRWDRFISSLKPIGLSILLNNCHSSVRKQRLGFFDNVNTIQRYFIPSSCITSLPLSFCLCGLASQIGFRDGAVNGFLTHGCLGAYSFCSAAYVANTNDSDGKDEPISQDTFPANLGNKDSPSHLAHSFSAVFSDFKTEDGYQLLSQGTGDILVSLCSDVWDGRDIIPLSERLRDLILGFHNRHLSSAYCVGFAYSPLVDKADESYKSLLNNLSDSSNILVLHLPGPDRVSPLLQRNIAAQHANRCRLNAKSPSLSHAVSTNDSDNSNDNDTVNNRPISAKCQSMSKLNGQFTSNFSKLVSKIKKIKFNSVSKLYHHKERSFATINIKNLKANGKRLRYAKNKLNKRNTSADMRGESELNPMNDSFDEYYDDSILGNFPKEKSVSEASAYDESGHLGCEQKGDFHIDPKEIKNILSNQIFLGLVSMQYQANPQVVKTIKQLHQACIRFVHFSRENELRSRVFAERLGLECGWNCHISLGSPDCVKIRKSSYPTKERFRSNRISFEREEFVYNRKYSTGDRQMNRSSSYSSLAKSHTLTSKRLTSISDSNLLRIVESDEEVSTSKSGKGNYAKSSSPTCPKLSQIGTKTQQPESDLQKSHVDNVNTSLRHSISLVDSQLFYSKENDLIESSSGSCHLSSSTTSTSSVSQSAGEQSSNSEDRKISELLIGNKSRLPYGIEGIRPHLENVDNVPLQVSLFTDCSPKAIGEMVRIMQEYGDTVCLVGSCYSLTNYALFMHSDVAIAVKPILPYSPCEFANNGLNSCKQPKEYHCSKSHSDFTSQKNSSTGVSMFDIAAHLIHLVTPCLLDMEKEGFRVYDLIVEAHISVNNLYHCLIFSSATPLSAGLLQLVLLIVGLPTRPVSLLNMNSNLHENELIWLPAQPFRSYVFGPMEIFNNLSRSDMQTNVNLLRFSSNCNLEPNFSIGQVLWFLFVVIPALSLSLIDRRVEQDQPLREPPIKRNKLFTKKRCIRFALVTCSRFIPSIIICKSFHSTYANRSNGENVFITNSSAFSDVSLLSQSYAIQELCLSKLSLLVYSVKDLIFYQFITYIVIISFSYANHGQRMWQFRYHTNPTWCIVSCSIVIVHSVYIIVRFCSTDSSSKLTSWHILSPTVLAFGFISCILLVFINEFVSWKESRAIFTEHRLSRLYFNTKLGMYSPV
ncbi:unnamed protein product [Heterobilharzia americana]|nr:unnamed protein product [Heterobilharzia americana]